eukprot:g10457.t1
MGKKSKEVVVAEVPAADATVIAEKKKKKSKKEAEQAVPEVVEVASKRPAEEPATGEEPAKKKKKKNKDSSEAAAPADEVAVEALPAAEAGGDEGGKKKKKKDKKSAEAEVTPMEVDAAETVETKSDDKAEKKKKKKAAVVEEPAATPSTVADEGEEEKAEVEPPTASKTETATADDDENKSVIIFGLPYSADEETVKKDFSECGEIVGFRMPTNKETGEYRGMAFIDFATKAGVDAALEYNETDYSGRTLRVRMCEQDPNKGGDKGKGKKGKDGKGKGKGKDGGKGKGFRDYVPSEKPEDCKSIIIKFMNYETTEDSIRSHFEPCGSISNLKIITDRETGYSKGMAFVDFETTDAVDSAIDKCNNTELDGKKIGVDYSNPNGNKGSKGGKDGEKGKGKGKGKDGKGGKGKGKKGKKEGDSIKAANMGSIVESKGASKSFDSDSE